MSRPTCGLLSPSLTSVKAKPKYRCLSAGRDANLPSIFRLHRDAFPDNKPPYPSDFNNPDARPCPLPSRASPRLRTGKTGGQNHGETHHFTHRQTRDTVTPVLPCPGPAQASAPVCSILHSIRFLSHFFRLLFHSFICFQRGHFYFALTQWRFCTCGNLVCGL